MISLNRIKIKRLSAKIEPQEFEKIYSEVDGENVHELDDLSLDDSNKELCNSLFEIKL